MPQQHRGKNVKEAEGGTKRKRRVLNKTEKTKIMLSLCVLLRLKNTWKKFLVECNFGMLWKSESLMKEIMLSLTNTFASLYKSCDKGKCKYLNFQLEWHRYCSVFLLPPGKDVSDVDYDVQKHSELARLQQRWIGFCEGKSVDSDIRCSVMISLCNAVYKYFLNLVS